MLKSASDTMSIEMDDEKVQGKFIAAFFNLTQHFGQQMRAAPKAVLDDNRLDAVMLTQASRGTEIRVLIVSRRYASNVHASEGWIACTRPFVSLQTISKSSHSCSLKDCIEY